MILPISIEKQTLNHYEPTQRFQDYNMNIRAILMPFFLGTGGYIGRAMSILGVGGGIWFERSYHRHSPAIGRTIIKICDDIIFEAQNKEILVSLKEEMSENFDSVKEKEIINDINIGKPYL